MTILVNGANRAHRRFRRRQGYEAGADDGPLDGGFFGPKSGGLVRHFRLKLASQPKQQHDNASRKDQRDRRAADPTGQPSPKPSRSRHKSPAFASSRPACGWHAPFGLLFMLTPSRTYKLQDPTKWGRSVQSQGGHQEEGYSKSRCAPVLQRSPASIERVSADSTIGLMRRDSVWLQKKNGFLSCNH